MWPGNSQKSINLDMDGELIYSYIRHPFAQRLKSSEGESKICMLEGTADTYDYFKLNTVLIMFHIGNLSRVINFVGPNHMVKHGFSSAQLSDSRLWKEKSGKQKCFCNLKRRVRNRG